MILPRQDQDDSEDESIATAEPDAGFGQVTIHEDRSIPGVLSVRVLGRGGDPEAALRRWGHIITRAHEEGLRQLLVFRDLAGAQISEAELATLMAELAVFDLDGLRIALVQPHDERYRIDELATLLAMEQGADARVFPDEASATLWLRYGDD